MRKLILTFALWLLAWSLSAHPWKPQHYVVIDTDCGLDDFRALCMLIASPDIRVLAITTSDGVLDAKQGLVKVRSLLFDLRHEGILTGYQANPDVHTAQCLPALNMAWGDSVSDVSDASEAVDVVNYVLENSGEKITFISLGSLGTARLCAEKCPGFRTRVSRILWSNSPDDRTHSFNFNLDRISASRVLSGNTPVCLISGGSLDHYDTALIDAIGELNTLCAVKVKSSLQTSEDPYARAFFDESTAVFLHYPSLFHADTAGTLIQYKLRPSGAGNDIHSAISLILSGETVIQNQVLNRFPLDTSCYFADVQHGMQETLSRFGREEWIAGVMANEMHRHLGVYAVIGVKMGIRAKEYFGAGIDEMSIISYAGSTPPFSCMNDGLQVSTGATLGHGLIKITSDSPILPQADFIYMNRRIRLTLKPEVRSKVDSEIRELSRIYGLDSNIYWELVRKAAIMYWNTLDRQDIFTVQVL